MKKKKIRKGKILKFFSFENYAIFKISFKLKNIFIYKTKRNFMKRKKNSQRKDRI